MRLSDIKGERAFDVIADLIDPIGNIATDENAKEMFRKAHLPKGVSEKSFLLNRIKKFLPPLLKNRKADIIAVLSTLEGVDIEEYAKTLTLPKLFKECTELLTDAMFKDLFISAQSQNSSTSAPVNTEAPKE